MILPTPGRAHGQVYLVLVDFGTTPATIATSASYSDDGASSTQPRATRGRLPSTVAGSRPEDEERSGRVLLPFAAWKNGPPPRV